MCMIHRFGDISVLFVQDNRMTRARGFELCIVERIGVDLIHDDEYIFGPFCEPIFAQYALDTCVGGGQIRSYQSL